MLANMPKPAAATAALIAASYRGRPEVIGARSERRDRPTRTAVSVGGDHWKVASGEWPRS